MSFDRMENREKRLKLLLAFGSSSAALTVAAAIFGWAWGPLSANWTLPPQPVVEDAAPPKKVDKRWSSLRMPVATISGPMAKNEPQIEPQADETMIMADLGASYAAIQPSAGQNESSTGDTNEFHFGLGPNNFTPGGGSGRTWRGTLNPNPSGPRAISFPDYSPVGSGVPGPGKLNPEDDPCKAPDAASNPACSSGPGPDDDDDDDDDSNADGGSCITWDSTVNGPDQSLNDQRECEDETANNDDTGNTDEDNTDEDNSSCVGWNSSVSGPGQTVNNGGNCEEQTSENENDGSDGNDDGVGGSCVTWTSVIGGQTVTHYSEGCQMPPTTPPVSNVCLSDEGCGSNGTLPGDSVVAVPEPGSMALLLTGMAGLLALRRRR